EVVARPQPRSQAAPRIRGEENIGGGQYSAGNERASEDQERQDDQRQDGRGVRTRADDANEPHRPIMGDGSRNPEHLERAVDLNLITGGNAIAGTAAERSARLSDVAGRAATCCHTTTCSRSGEPRSASRRPPLVAAHLQILCRVDVGASDRRMLAWHPYCTCDRGLSQKGRPPCCDRGSLLSVRLSRSPCSARRRPFPLNRRNDRSFFSTRHMRRRPGHSAAFRPAVICRRPSIRPSPAIRSSFRPAPPTPATSPCR